MIQSVKILIVEDEAIIAEDLRMSLIELGYDVVGVRDNYDDAMIAIEALRPDFLLLDIIINGDKDGITLAADIGLKFHLPFLFLTSHSDRATVERAKTVRPAGYLLKPFEQDDLYTAIEIGLSNFASQKVGTPDDKLQKEQKNIIIKNSFFVKDNHAYIKIVFDDVLYLKSEGNYVKIFTNNSSHLIRGSLKSTIDALPQNLFFKTNRSHVVNIKQITSIMHAEVKIGATILPLNKDSREELLSLLQTL